MSVAKIKQRGDTIVEVLFAVVIIGVTLGASFGIANRSVQIGRAAQERTEALKIAESKIELLKIAYEDTGSPVRNQAGQFCLEFVSGSMTVSVGACSVSYEGGVPYSVTLESVNDTPKTFEANVLWDRIGTNSTEQGTLSLYYRPGVL